MVPKAPSLAYTSYSSGDGVESLSSDQYSSIRSPWLAWCNRIDEAVSIPIFELSLPTSVEAVFSIPACFFGLIPSVVLGPILLGYLGIRAACDGIVSDITIRVLEAILLSCSTMFLGAWILFLRGNRWVLPHFLGRKILYVLAVPWSVGILYWVLHPDGDSSGEESDLTRNRIFSLAIYSLWLWDWVLLAVLGLKKWSKRLRPCLKYSRDFIQETKSFPAIPIMLSKTQGDESFPSGDAATAAAMAIDSTSLH